MISRFLCFWLYAHIMFHMPLQVTTLWQRKINWIIEFFHAVMFCNAYGFTKILLNYVNKVWHRYHFPYFSINMRCICFQNNKAHVLKLSLSIPQWGVHPKSLWNEKRKKVFTVAISELFSRILNVRGKVS